MKEDRDEELRDLLTLTMVQGVGPITCRALLEYFGSAGKVLKASMTALKEIDGVGPKLAAKIASARHDHDPESELAECRQHKVTPIPFTDDRYPAILRDTPDPPSLIYVKGTLLPQDGMALALVGSRKTTAYGSRIAERLAASAARVGLTVVSGLARGIDAAAHRGALKAGGRTIAVMANGLSSIYPPEHEKLAEEIAEAGAVITEMPMRQGALAELFPRRNRIISGLSLGVVIVEAAPKSGSLATARHAIEQNREVFAVPGPVDSLSSRGCHALIRDGAKLTETIDDVLDELRPKLKGLQALASSGGAETAAPPSPLPLNGHEQVIMTLLSDVPQPADDVIRRSGLTAGQVIATLSVLEMRRLVKRVPGNQFIRL